MIEIVEKKMMLKAEKDAQWHVSTFLWVCPSGGNFKKIDSKIYIKS